MARGTSLYFLRHGDSVANAKGLLAGQTPGIDLTAKGRDQITQIGEYFASYPIDVALTSPLERTVQSAALFLATHNCDAQIDPSFIEMNYGYWSNKKLKALASKPEWKIVQGSPQTFTFPKGESFLSAWTRIVNRINFLVSDKNFAGKKILVVSHGDIIKMAITYALDLPLSSFQRFRVDTASISQINYIGNQFSVSQLNFNLHNHSTVFRNFTLGGEVHKSSGVRKLK